jgi:hypothetical protein
MAETIIETHRRLEFNTLFPGDSLTITTGVDTEAWNYGFTVLTNGYWPHGTLEATNPRGDRSEPIDFELHGCGRWTTRKQNPVQTQEIGFTPYYHGLIVGDFMWGRTEGVPDWIRFDKPGQEISNIIRAPYRENRALRILGDHAGAMSVKQVLEVINGEEPKAIRDYAAELSKSEVRSVLGNLVALGYVSLQKKNVQKFSLRSE